MSIESEPNKESVEKPEFLFHGSIGAGIELLEPRKRYTPSAGVPERVYASGNPAFAAAHSFPWSSDEGIDLRIEDGKLILMVPRRLASRLEQPVSIYRLPSEYFEFTEEESMKLTYHSVTPVAPIEAMPFDSVTEAVEHFGGMVEILEE